MTAPAAPAPRLLRVRCARWDQVESFLRKKLRTDGRLSMKVPFDAELGAPVTLQLELPNQIVIALDGAVAASSELDRPDATVVALAHARPAIERLEAMLADARAAGDGGDLAATLSVREAELRRLRQQAAHEVLGVSRTPTLEELRRAWRLRARREHPDAVARFGSAALRLTAEEAMIHVTRAYERLRATVVAENRAVIAGTSVRTRGSLALEVAPSESFEAVALTPSIEDLYPGPGTSADRFASASQDPFASVRQERFASPDLFASASQDPFASVRQERFASPDPFPFPDPTPIPVPSPDPFLSLDPFPSPDPFPSLDPFPSPSPSPIRDASFSPSWDSFPDPIPSPGPRPITSRYPVVSPSPEEQASLDATTSLELERPRPTLPPRRVTALMPVPRPPRVPTSPPPTSPPSGSQPEAPRPSPPPVPPAALAPLFDTDADTLDGFDRPLSRPLALELDLPLPPPRDARPMAAGGLAEDLAPPRRSPTVPPGLPPIASGPPIAAAAQAARTTGRNPGAKGARTTGGGSTIEQSLRRARSGPGDRFVRAVHDRLALVDHAGAAQIATAAHQVYPLDVRLRALIEIAAAQAACAHGDRAAALAALESALAIDPEGTEARQALAAVQAAATVDPAMIQDRYR